MSAPFRLSAHYGVACPDKPINRRQGRTAHGRAAYGQAPAKVFFRALTGLPPVAHIHAGRRVLTKDRIVAVGLLTQRDLDVLGTGFNRLFPVDTDDGLNGFTDLIARLDKIDATTTDREAARSVKLHLNQSDGKGQS